MKMKEAAWSVGSETTTKTNTQIQQLDQGYLSKRNEQTTNSYSTADERTRSQNYRNKNSSHGPQRDQDLHPVNHHHHHHHQHSHHQVPDDNTNESIQSGGDVFDESSCETQAMGDVVTSRVFIEECLPAKRARIDESPTAHVGLSRQEERCNPSESLQDSQSQEQEPKARQGSSKSRLQQTGKSKPPGSRKEETDVNLSFCGCGFLGIYHVGVASCFHQYAPQLSMHKIAGSSVGALVAISHICGNLQLAYCTTDILTLAIEARSHTLGSFHPSYDIQASVRESLERGLPEDAFVRASGKLHVSLTRVEDGENVIISEFGSNEDLIQVLLCSCFIPLWSGIKLPKYKGVAYMDGGFSNNLLILDDKTVTVSAFAGEADICPQDDTLNLLQISLCNTSFSISPNNLYRLTHALLPPEPEVLSDLCKQGFADGIRYLQRMDLISCTKCLEIRSSLLITTTTTTTTTMTTTTGEQESDQVYSLAANSNIEATVNYQRDHGSTPRRNSSECRTGPLNLDAQQQGVAEENDDETRLGVVEQRRRSGSIVSITSTSKRIHLPASKHTENQLVTKDESGNNSKLKRAVSLHSLLSVLESDEISLVATNDDEESDEASDDCVECVLIRQRALYDPLPKQFSDRIREVSDRFNRGLARWLYSHRPVKYLTYLMIPYYVPIDLALAIIQRFWKKLPLIKQELSEQVNQVLGFMIIMLKRMQTRSTSAMLMGYGTSWEEDVLAYERELLMQKQEPAQVYHHHHHHHQTSVIAAESWLDCAKSGAGGASRSSTSSKLLSMCAWY